MPRNGGEYYSVWFFDPVRAGQELDYDTRAGHPCFTEEGAFVWIPDVTVEAVVVAVRYLLKRGYFAYYRPDATFKPGTPGKYNQEVTSAT